MIDKDFGEISLLKFCHFHLKKYLRTEMAKSVYGGRNAADLDRVEDSDGGEYDCGLRYMYYIFDGFDGQESFLIRCIPSSIITFATGTPA
ncbi:hypothetical protein JG688_00009272 [Phytophthora aleatoria]|uniref:Uncharacterized protein n=1 Tax=Phytophthora aleatoria TaxID=2496075 RepID=A0A8J5M2H9_9STRA|nr:hypothetical protein JG688_00009272 [Phytophthora aleatoria]